MRRRLVAGNWKMNGSVAAVRDWCATVVQAAAEAPVDIALFPPYPLLAQAMQSLAGTNVQLGAQDVSMHASGAYTGEVSAAMLIEAGCRQVLVGHSERRSYHGETDEQVAAKFAVALDAGLVPVLCIGETLAQREGGETDAVVGCQLRAVLERVGGDGLAKGVIAYEPVWAIGTGRTASPMQAQAVHENIRGILRDANATMAGSMRILYGGSVNGDNAGQLFEMPDIDGALVGGASLNAREFLRIVRTA